MLKILGKNTERSWTRIKMTEEHLKQNLRQDMKEKRNNLTEDEKSCAAANCLSELRELPEFMDADWIYAYIACRNELETKPIILWCLRNGKHIAVPKVHGDKMYFYEITSLEDCKPGAFGILEPVGEEKDRIAEPGFMLVPGLAFDREKNRLGYGGGFYDKYIDMHEGLKTAALGYDFQLVEKIPVESHDKKMDYIVIGSVSQVVA